MLSIITELYFSTCNVVSVIICANIIDSHITYYYGAVVLNTYLRHLSYVID